MTGRCSKSKWHASKSFGIHVQSQWNRFFWFCLTSRNKGCLYRKMLNTWVLKGTLNISKWNQTDLWPWNSRLTSFTFPRRSGFSSFTLLKNHSRYTQKHHRASVTFGIDESCCWNIKEKKYQRVCQIGNWSIHILVPNLLRRGECK